MNNYNYEDICIMYLRKSRSDEKTGIENILKKHEDDLQLLAMKELGYPIPEKYIFREIVSGETIKDRPLMNEVLKIMETGKVKAVLVVDPQRLTRGDMLDQGHVVNAFLYTHTLIMTPFKTFDLNDSNDMKLFKMELDHGADYLDYFKMIQKRGIIASVRNGNYIGAKYPYAYEPNKYKDKGRKINTLSIVPEEAKIVEKLYADYAGGKTLRQLVKDLNDDGKRTRSGSAWTKTSVKRILTNPVYIGKIRWGYIETIKTIENGEIKKKHVPNSNYMLAEGLHEPIVDNELFFIVQERLKKNIDFRKSGEIRNPLAGLMYCGVCGSIIYYKKRSGKRNKENTFYYQCINHKSCRAKSINVYKLIEAVCEALEAVISDFETIIPNDDPVIDIKAEKRHLEALMNDLNQKEETMYDMLEKKVYSIETFSLRHASLEKQRQEIQEKLLELESMNLESRQDKKAHFTDALQALQSSSVPAKEKNILLKMCIEKIIYHVDKSSTVKNTKCNLDIHFKL